MILLAIANSVFALCMHFLFLVDTLFSIFLTPSSSLGVYFPWKILNWLFFFFGKTSVVYMLYLSTLASHL